MTRDVAMSQGFLCTDPAEGSPHTDPRLCQHPVFCAGMLLCASEQAKNLFSSFDREVELSAVYSVGS